MQEGRSKVSDEQRNPTDKAGPEEAARANYGIPGSPGTDSEGHMPLRSGSPEPTIGDEGAPRNRPLARLLAGEFVSSIGDWLYMVALLIVVYQTSHDPVLLGIVGVARIAPSAILSVPAGLLADRLDRGRILLATDLVRGLLMLVLAWLVATSAPVLAIVLVAIVATSAATFFGPAISAYLPRVVGDETQLGPANSLWATLDNLAFMIGPAVAGLLIATGGLQTAFLLNAVSFGVCALALVGLPHGRPEVPATDEAGRVDDAETGSSSRGPGWRAIGSLIRGPVVLDAATGFAGGGLSILTVVLAVDVLRAGEEATGYLNAATGVGGVVAGIIAAGLTMRRLDLPLLAAAVLGGVALVALGLTRDLSFALVAIGIAVGGLLILDVINTTLVQRLVPDALRGRAMGILQTTGVVAYGAGSLVAPILASIVGVTPVLAVLAVGMVGPASLSVVLLARTTALRPPVLDPVRVRLLRAPLFAGLPPGRLESIARELVPLTVQAGDVVVREGDPADRFYLIESGSYRVTQERDGAVHPLRTLGPDEVFGEIGLLGHGRRTATVTSEGDGRLWALERDAFLELVQAGPGLSTPPARPVPRSGADGVVTAPLSAPRHPGRLGGHSEGGWAGVVWEAGGRHPGDPGSGRTSDMNDEERTAKDEAGPPAVRGRSAVTEPTDADTEGHGRRVSPEPTVTEETESDTEGHRRKFHQPAPAMPGRPGPGEAASNEDASGAGPTNS